MANLTVSTDVDTLLTAANFAAFRSSLFGHTVTLAGNFITSGAFSTTLTATGATTLTLPTTGTLTTLAGSETFTNKTLTSPILNSGTIGTSLKPTSDDGAPLGDTTHNFSDLFLATGAVINFQAGNVAITHTSGILTMGTGDLRITTAGTNTASVVTVGGTQTLTNKTLTDAVVGTQTPLDSSTKAASTAYVDLAVTAGGGGGGGGDVTAASSFGTDNRIIRSDGTGKGVQSSGITIDDSDNITGVGTLSVTSGTVTTLVIGATTVTATGAELNFSVGVTSAIQTQLDAKAEISLVVPTVDGNSVGPKTSSFNCGYTSSAVGDLVYLDSSATWQKCDANTLALYNGMLGIALAVAASGAALLVALPGSMVYATGFPTFTIGSPVYMSETAGAVTQTAPTTTDAATRIIGWGIHADKLFFNPSGDYTTHT